MLTPSNYLGIIMAKIKEKKTRVALTLGESINGPLTVLSKLTNQPKTAIITELLTDIVPMIEEAIKAIKQVKEGQKDAVLNTMAEFIGNVNATYDQAKIDFNQANEKK
jgi:predicted DNA-binding protein